MFASLMSAIVGLAIPVGLGCFECDMLASMLRGGSNKRRLAIVAIYVGTVAVVVYITAILRTNAYFGEGVAQCLNVFTGSLAMTIVFAAAGLTWIRAKVCVASTGFVRSVAGLLCLKVCRDLVRIVDRVAAGFMSYGGTTEPPLLVSLHWVMTYTEPVTIMSIVYVEVMLYRKMRSMAIDQRVILALPSLIKPILATISFRLLDVVVSIVALSDVFGKHVTMQLTRFSFACHIAALVYEAWLALRFRRALQGTEYGGSKSGGKSDAKPISLLLDPSGPTNSQVCTQPKKRVVSADKESQSQRSNKH
jgi:hypothetical protein